MNKDYKVVFVDGKIGRQRGVEPVVFEQVEDLDQLTNRVEKHARKFLMSNDVGCFIENNITRHGKVFAGVRNVAEFDFTVTRVYGTGPKIVLPEPAVEPVQQRCSWDRGNSDHCTNPAEGRYMLWGEPRELCAFHGGRSERRIGDLVREEVPF